MKENFWLCLDKNQEMFPKWGNIYKEDKINIKVQL
jgi:hypothetical protein